MERVPVLSGVLILAGLALGRCLALATYTLIDPGAAQPRRVPEWQIDRPLSPRGTLGPASWAEAQMLRMQ